MMKLIAPLKKIAMDLIELFRMTLTTYGFGKSWLTALFFNPVFLSFLISAVVFSILMIVTPEYYSIIERRDLHKNIIANIYASLLDLILIGFAIQWLSSIGAKRRENINYQNDIYILRNDATTEGLFHKRLAIMRLARNGITNIDLSKNILPNFDFRNVNLSGSNFTHSDLTKSIFNGSFLYNSNFTNANLTEASFDYCDMQRCNLTNAHINFEQLSKVISLYECTIDTNIRESLMHKFEDLIVTSGIFRPKYYWHRKANKSTYHIES